MPHSIALHGLPAPHAAAALQGPTMLPAGERLSLREMAGRRSATGPESVQWLLSHGAVQRHAADVLAHVQAGGAAHFGWDAGAFDALAARVLQALRADDAPAPRQRPWSRYASGGVDRWGELAWAEGLAPGALADHHCIERARTRVDLLLVTAVLACEPARGWRLRDAASAQELGGADALAVGALRLFASGACSAQPHHPLRADAVALAALQASDLAAAFPAWDGRPLPGLERRAARLRRLGAVAQAHPWLFAPTEDPQRLRLGHLLDSVLDLCVDEAAEPPGRLQAEALITLLLVPLNTLTPGRLAWRETPLGDCWAHPHAPQGLVPLHGLAQWLALGCIEPLRDAGLTLEGLGAAPAAASWRLGGWLLDAGVLRPRGRTAAGPQPRRGCAGPHRAAARLDDPAVVEWRAASVAAIEQLAQTALAQHDTPARWRQPGALHGLLCRLAREDAERLRADATPAWLPDAGALMQAGTPG